MLNGKPIKLGKKLFFVSCLSSSTTLSHCHCVPQAYLLTAHFLFVSLSRSCCFGLAMRVFFFIRSSEKVCRQNCISNAKWKFGRIHSLLSWFSQNLMRNEYFICVLSLEKTAISYLLLAFAGFFLAFDCAKLFYKFTAAPI